MTAPHGTLSRYKRGPGQPGTAGGCRCTPCREANNAWQRNQYRLAAYGKWEPYKDAAGTRRRLQALIWNGWSLTALGTRLGCTRQAIRYRLTYDQVTVAVAGQVRALYDELWNQAPPERTRDEKRTAGMARRYARDRGWVPAGAWDEDPGPHCIDDPDAVPVPGWERRDGIRRWGVLAEDATHLLRSGMTMEHVAERLGVTQSTLREVLSRARRAQDSRQQGEAA